LFESDVAILTHLIQTGSTDYFSALVDGTASPVANDVTDVYALYSEEPRLRFYNLNAARRLELADLMPAIRGYTLPDQEVLRQQQEYFDREMPMWRTSFGSMVRDTLLYKYYGRELPLAFLCFMTGLHGEESVTFWFARAAPGKEMFSAFMEEVRRTHDAS
jgi:hypothetical protein